MTTLAELTLMVARQITDVLEGTATAGAGTSLTDTVSLTQRNQYWDKGTVWILTGTHAGKLAVVTSHLNNVLKFADFGSSVGTPRYAVARAIFPWAQLRQAVNQALDEVRVTGIDETLTGDGATLSFDLPAGVSDVYAVEFVDEQDEVTPGHHWKERNGKLIFERHYAPWNGDTIRILYKTPHAELVNYSDVIDDEINLTWLKWAAAGNALRWGMRVYQNDPALKLGDFMNEALQRVEKLQPLRRPRINIKTAG